MQFHHVGIWSVINSDNNLYYDVYVVVILYYVEGFVIYDGMYVRNVVDIWYEDVAKNI